MFLWQLNQSSVCANIFKQLKRSTLQINTLLFGCGYFGMCPLHVLQKRILAKRFKTLQFAVIVKMILYTYIPYWYICIWMHRFIIFASSVYRKIWKKSISLNPKVPSEQCLWNVCWVYFDLITSRFTKDTLAYTHILTHTSSHQNNEFLVLQWVWMSVKRHGLFDNELPLFNDLCHKRVQCKRSRRQKPKELSTQFHVGIVLFLALQQHRKVTSCLSGHFSPMWNIYQLFIYFCLLANRIFGWVSMA